MPQQAGTSAAEPAFTLEGRSDCASPTGRNILYWLVNTQGRSLVTEPYVVFEHQGPHRCATRIGNILGTLRCVLTARLSLIGDLYGGASRARTDDLIVANDALSQLSYSPTSGMDCWFANSFYQRSLIRTTTRRNSVVS